MQFNENTSMMPLRCGILLKKLRKQPFVKTSENGENY
jgi:hypothetical protein